MLDELAHERCHEGNPFFALSCRFGCFDRSSSFDTDLFLLLEKAALLWRRPCCARKAYPAFPVGG
jgi:hypothetical protein